MESRPSPWALALSAWALGACGAPPPAPVPDSACAICHAVQSAAFAGSRHARATDSDLFRALRARATDPDRAFCDNCHAAHDVPGERGVGCVTCHQATGDREVRNAALVLDPSGPLRGPLGSPTSAHATAPGGYLTSADLCGTCHEVAGPGAFVETPYTEWYASPAAAAGISCVRCHMASAPGDPDAMRPTGPAAVGAPLRSLSDHAFVGPDDPRAGELLGRAAAVAVRVLSEDTAGVAVEVTVTNRNAAHALPSGARFAREVWLEVSALDAAGGDHLVSGGTDAAGLPLADDPQRVDLGDRVTRAGAPALPTESDPPVVRAVPAGGRRTYQYLVPAEWSGGQTTAVRVTLRYRRNAAALRRALGLPPDTVGPVDLASATTLVQPR